MSRRLDVELTSRRDDGSWTWRAAGAKQPKGVLDGGLLPPGAGEGDVLRVDAEFEIDGIFITGVLPPKARSGRPESERIELLGPPERNSRSVTTTGVSGRGGRRRGGEGGRESNRAGERDSKGPRRKRDGDRRKRDRPADSEGDEPQRRKRREGDTRRREGGAKRQRRDAASKAMPETPDRPPRPKARKLRPSRKHRDELIASLPAEQQVIAEQVARGGLAAVRTGIDEQNRKAAAQGAPEVPADGVLRLAESLVGPVQIAEWHDRADAALAGIERVDLRDLRSVLVAAEDFARGAEARELADKIREGLNERVEASQREWHDELRTTLAEGRVVRALRLSSRPPKAGAPLPPEVAQELTTQANAALGTGNSQHRIAVVLEAVAFSPVRPYVVVPSVPAEPSEELIEVVRKIASRLPEVAAAFGVEPSAANPRGQSRRGPRRRPKPEPKADADEAVAKSDAEDATAESVADEATAESDAEDAAAESDADEATAHSDAEDVAVEELAHPG
ncbi:hypothetical protein [Candidatus Poriferisodalis sp.]|uniref:hypothetical protein n=1 Tax=Candidatus Poriferisodalis sp. TaxID=3101277 RepID=UPI003B023BA6